jgi:hypothetical protein
VVTHGVASCRLHGPLNKDVRPASALATFKLTQLARRITPAAAGTAPSAGGPAGGAAAGGTTTARLLHSGVTTTSSDYFSVAGSQQDSSTTGGMLAPSVQPGGVDLVLNAQAALPRAGGGGFFQQDPPGAAGSVFGRYSSGADSRSAGGGGVSGGGSGTGGGAGSAWRPRGVLVAHLMEHRRAVTDLAVSANGAFMVSTSNDETAKVCDDMVHDIVSRLVSTGVLLVGWTAGACKQFKRQCLGWQQCSAVCKNMCAHAFSCSDVHAAMWQRTAITIHTCTGNYTTADGCNSFLHVLCALVQCCCWQFELCE